MGWMAAMMKVRLLGITASALGVLALLLLGIGAFGAPQAGAAKHCSIIVTRLGGGFTSSAVTVTVGRTDCEHARRVLYKAFATKPYKERQIEGWNCTSTLRGNGVFAATCETEGERVGREVIKSSRPRACPGCSKARD
jgi:hypothetical protein